MSPRGISYSNHVRHPPFHSVRLDIVRCVAPAVPENVEGNHSCLFRKQITPTGIDPALRGLRKPMVHEYRKAFACDFVVKTAA